MKQREEMLEICKSDEQFTKFQRELVSSMMRCTRNGIIIGITIGGALSACLVFLIVGIMGLF